MKPFTFHNPGKLVFGEGSAKKRVKKELNKLGASRPVLVTDETISASEMVETVKDALGDSMAALFNGVVPDTGIDIIDKAAEIAREDEADSVVSVGGGSSIDTAKAVASILGSQADSVREIIGFNKLANSPAPHVAIPTTAGTGSECTSMAMVKDRQGGKKLVIMDQKLIPQVGILDPTFTRTMPKGVTAATGMDALTHAVEAIVSTNSMPPADALAMQAISVIHRFLPKAFEDPEDMEARSMMLVASAEAGQAFQNAYVGIVHAMAHALGGIVGLPHGLANGILLPVGMEYNAYTVPEKVALVGSAMGIEGSGDPAADARETIKAVQELAAKVGIPDRLRNAGVDPECVEQASAFAMVDPALFTNPRQPKDSKEMEDLFAKCM